MSTPGGPTDASAASGAEPTDAPTAGVQAAEDAAAQEQGLQMPERGPEITEIR